MHVDIHWGNLNKFDVVTQDEVDKVITKNLEKISRFLKKIDDSTVRINFNFKYDEHKKRYKVTLYMTTPKSNFHITESGFSLEETVKGSIHNLRRKFRKTKERRRTLNRKKIVLN